MKSMFQLRADKPNNLTTTNADSVHSGGNGKRPGHENLAEGQRIGKRNSEERSRNQFVTINT